MSADYDASEFIDGDFQRQKFAAGAPAAGSPSGRAPTREEVDARVAEAQQKLAELKRAQEELERERAFLEETRRRQAEFQTGRQEMIQNLTRGVGLLEEGEFSHRKEAEQMSKTVGDLKDALGKVQSIHEETWSKENFNVQLTQALTILENARMEWNSARLKFPLLSGQSSDLNEMQVSAKPAFQPLSELDTAQLCRLGLALTWPIAAAVLAGAAALIVVLARH